jgi:hypothetical protein
MIRQIVPSLLFATCAATAPITLVPVRDISVDSDVNTAGVTFNPTYSGGGVHFYAECTDGRYCKVPVLANGP